MAERGLSQVARSKRLGGVGSLWGYLTAGGKVFLLCESGTVVLLLTSAASAPWCPSHAGTGMLHTLHTLGGGGGSLGCLS